MSVDAAEFEVDEHYSESSHPEDPEHAPPQEQEPPSPIELGWTPEEATALVCALWNLGILLYGPEWTADPRETVGWNTSLAQLLDLWVPKDTGGYVQVGAGLLMIGNGVMMMAARRTEIIRRGPRPLWARKPQAEGEAAPAAAPTPAPAAAPRRDNGNGSYTIPNDLLPKPKPDLEL